jgi:hypothetical protein
MDSYANEKSNLITIHLEEGRDAKKTLILALMALTVFLVLPMLLSTSKPVSVRSYEKEPETSPSVAPPGFPNEEGRLAQSSQVFWDTPHPEKQCSGYHTRRYTARLKGLPLLANWKAACENTSIQLNGRTFERPEACERKVGIENHFPSAIAYNWL